MQTAIPIQRAATFHHVQVRLSCGTGARSSFQSRGSGDGSAITMVPRGARYGLQVRRSRSGARAEAGAHCDSRVILHAGGASWSNVRRLRACHRRLRMDVVFTSTRVSTDNKRSPLARAHPAYVYRRLGGGKSRVAGARIRPRLRERSPTPFAYPLLFNLMMLHITRRCSSNSLAPASGTALCRPRRRTCRHELPPRRGR